MTLQQRAARTVPVAHAMRPTTIGRLLIRPLWLAGILISGIGFLLQLAALRIGSVVVVQPIVTTALVVCLATTSWWDRVALGPRTWVAILAVIAGVAVFVTAGGSADGRSASHPSLAAILLASLVVALSVASSMLATRRTITTAAAVMLGAAAGYANAYVAVVARVALRRMTVHGFASALTSTYAYTAVVVAGVAVVLVQAIYQARRPTLSLPVAAVVEAGGSVLLAMLVLGEDPRLTGLRGSVAVLGLVAALVGLAAVGREDARLTSRHVPPTL